MEHLIHLSKDKRLKKLIDLQPAFILDKRDKVYLRLCSSILSRQLSITVAKVLYKRFLELFGSKEPTAKQMLATPVETFHFCFVLLNHWAIACCIACHDYFIFSNKAFITDIANH
jgi:3-methyladenine DNA glycosylase/8-oxoguanine DNA glycosylase